jgi:NAD(P)-dependent dehydrogenase (short-subunit alcohol dehydrogenase family)
MRLDRYFGLAGRTALITGATRGIGLAMSHAFADAGAQLVIASDEAAAGAALAHELEAGGTACLAHACDVAEPSELAGLVAAATARFAHVDVLVCNAGIPGPHGPLAAASESEIERLFAINLLHPLRLSNLVAPRMAARGEGSIILTASIAGMRGNRNVGLYGMAKAALIQLARNLAVEWGPTGVRANAIAPGLVRTAWASNVLANPEATERRLSLTPLRRIAEPWEIASAALFLAGPGAAFITGQTLVIDGGTLITDGN